MPWSYLSPALLCRIMAEVPGVIGVKQSAGDLKLLADLLIAARPESRIFSAVDALLYPSFALGAQGAIAAILAAAPGACVQLWDAVQAGDHARALDLHRRLLVLWNALVADNLPACTKHAQALQGVPVGPAARPDAARLAGPAAGDPGGAARAGLSAGRRRRSIDILSTSALASTAPDPMCQTGVIPHLFALQHLALHISHAVERRRPAVHAALIGLDRSRPDASSLSGRGIWCGERRLMARREASTCCVILSSLRR